MSEELDDYDADLESLEAEIRKGTKALAKLKGDKREEKIKFLTGRIKHMRVIHRTYKVELRELDKDEKKPYEQKYHEHEETITRLVQDLDWAKADGDRAELGTKYNAAGGAGGAGGEPTRDQLLDKADEIQKKDLSAVERMKTKVADAAEIGAATNEAIHQQTGQLTHTVEVLDEQKVLLQQASLQLRAFSRRIASDKIMIGFICLIVVLVIVLIVVNAVAPKALDNAITLPNGLTFAPQVSSAIQAVTLPSIPNIFVSRTDAVTNMTTAAISTTLTSTASAALSSAA